MIIAIDGPAGSGKSTVAKIIAKKLRFRHIETGAMYRAVAWKGLRLGIRLSDESAVAQVADRLSFDFIPGKAGQTILVDGEDITKALQNEAIGKAAAQVAAQEEVRDILVRKQREIGRSGGVVMDGRDIGTVVFPEADVKFFLDADPVERGKRRFLELKSKNEDPDLDTIVDQVKKRDHEDRNRKISPLQSAPDATVLDTTNLPIEEVVEHMMRLIQLPRV